MKIKWMVGAGVAMLGLSAHAETGNVNVYGLINMSYDSIDNGNAVGAYGTRVSKVSSNASRIGFKGEEDLGDGLAAVWQIESLVLMDTGSGNFATRNSFGGLRSKSYGTLLMGLSDTPYKIAGRRVDVFGEVLADNRTLMGGVAGKSSLLQFDGRQGNSLSYTSPKMNGLTGAVAYVAGAESATAGAVKGDAWSMAGMYENEGIYGALAYEVHSIGTAGTGTLAGGATPSAFAGGGKRESAWKLATTYDFHGLGGSLDKLGIGFIYESSRDNFGGTGAAAPVASCTQGGRDCYGHRAFTIAAKYGLANENLKFAYTRAGNLAGSATGQDTSATLVSLGLDHALSKRTTLYALATRLRNGLGINYSLASTGVTTGTTAAAGNGAAVSGVSLGIKHVF